MTPERPRLSRRNVLAAGAAGGAALVIPGGPAGAHPSGAGAVDAAVEAAAGPAGSGRPGTRRYVWRNVEIVGGGFVPGIVFNQRERGLVYARTDIGGAYRYDRRTERWIPLLDWVGWDQWGYTGVVSLATDAVDPDRLYLAVGTYTNGSDPNNGAILRSRDRGASWRVSELPFKLGGNMPGRGMGERLAIDPNANRILYLGVRGGHGLWRSEDHGASWGRVTNFPNPGNYADDPSDPSGYSSDNQGVLWVAFDPRTRKGGPGRPTGTIYVGVADKANMLYRSTDAGRTWERVPGQPTGFIPHKGVVDAGGTLYVATSDTAGPYSGGKGDVWKLDPAGTWTRISPVPSDSPEDTWGYSGLTLDRRRPGTLMVATQISWWPDTIFFRSTDAGATWTRAWQITNWPERVNRYEIDYSEAPWLTWNSTPAPPEQAPKLGWMTESVEIDPFDSDHLLYGTGATIDGTRNLTAWDTGGTVRISVRARGLEECAVLDLISPPTGAHLLSAVGDVGGFAHHDFANPGRMFADPTLSSGTSIDFAENAPSVVVRTGNGGPPRFGRSTDGGATWTPAATEPPGTSGGGLVAVSADGARALWAPTGGPVSWTGDGGATWTASTGVPAGAAVGSDRADPSVFYAFAAGTFYRSVDGGATFTATPATGLPATGNVRFTAVPGIAGEIWFAGGATGGTYGLWRSTDGGASFVRHPGIDEADTVGFGRPAPGSRFPAVFSSARIGGVRGIFRSDDRGRTWVRVNDDQHQYAWTGAAITGDPRVFGRVYVATNGRGIIYGDPA
ncbi:WD40/YVTN/BNR-like repeat-containing protein [Virgisporangium aurantiacum]|nr:sialidase family protein [Virgisporangium aurantiacum]